MPVNIFGADVIAVLRDAQVAAQQQQTKDVIVDGVTRSIRTPFPSPVDWRDCWIYFFMLDRFNRSDGVAPASTKANPPIAWNGQYGFPPFGTLKGVKAQLRYLRPIGV